MEIQNIIVEGPDCSGKSSVVNRIKNELRWDSKSLHHREGDQFNRYLKEYALSTNTVFDRSHFSEEVYSILWRNGSPFSEKEKNILNEICKLKVLIIFACPKLKVMQARYESRSYEQQIRFDELAKSRGLFCNVFTDVPHIIYYSDNYEELDGLVERIKEMIK